MRPFDGQYRGLEPAQPGNSRAVVHGARVSAVKLAADPRTRELAEAIRETMPVYSVADEIAIELLSVVLRRIERSVAAVERVDQALGDNVLAAFASPSAPYLAALRHDLRGWVQQAARLADQLGMTPTSRARLGLDLVRSEGELAKLRETGAEVRRLREVER